MQKDIELSIIMPCLNESETLKICILKAQDFIKNHNINGEIIIADNGSTDGSQSIAISCGAKVVDVPLKGYGAALWSGIYASSGKYCIMGDSDDSYDFTSLEMFVDKLRGGADLVMGNRFLGGIKIGAMPWKNRYIGNPILSGLGRFLFKTSIGDFHCGLRGFSRKAFDVMDLKTTGMEFASEMVIKASLLGLKIEEVPTTLSPDGRSRPPHLRPYRDGWRHLRFMFLYSPKWIFLYPGILLIGIGILVGGTLLYKSINIGGVRLGIDTLIYSATCIEIGYQALMFSLVSQAYASHEGILPKSQKTNFFERHFTLEIAICLGFFIMSIGGIIGIYALNSWAKIGFEMLDIEFTARLVISSCLFLSIGLQTIFSSLLLSCFLLRVR
jgi:glycosyltransferase involved in cell wall biosynthesis